MLICAVIADIIFVVSILLFCKIIFGYKGNNQLTWLKLAITIVSVIGVSLYINLGNDFIIEMIVYLILICGLSYVLFEEKTLGVIISSIWSIFLIEMLDIMSVTLIDMVAGALGGLNSGATRIIRALVLLIFVAMIGKLYNKRYNRGIKTIGIGSLIAFTLLTVFDAIIVMVIGYIVTNGKELVYQRLYFVALVLVIIGLFIQLGAVILLLMQRNIYREGQQITEKYLEEQKNHYEYLEKREKETKKFRHDLKSHMEMLTSLAKKHDYEQFDKYIDEINVNIDSFGNSLSVHNDIVDAIINKYYSEAVSNDIKMTVKGRLPKRCDIDAYDLCTIFSNVMSNAFEAAIEAKDRWIRVDCRYNPHNIIVNVRNSFDDNKKAHKKDTNYHGFGLENIKDAIRKYNGRCDIEIQGNVYEITISFEYGSYEEECELQ